MSSPYLARGYWKRPDWTAARFREIHGVRTFLSGDLGRLRPDGCLEHLGRADSRLRVRGTSVDGAAVEAALQALPGVRDARVRPRPDDGGDGIVGYVVAEERRPPTVSAIRRGLLTRLPEHAVPATFVMLPSLPLDENGKVDVRRLPSPPRCASSSKSPRSPGWLGRS